MDFKFDGSNYELWKFGIQLILEAEGLMGFVDGRLEEPEKATKLKEWTDWKQDSSYAAHIIFLSVEKSLRIHLINDDNPGAMWNKLKTLCAQSGENAKEKAWELFYEFSIKEDESIVKQLEKFETICKGLADSGENISDSAVVSKLLCSLPPRYSLCKDAWKAIPEGNRKKEAFLEIIIGQEKQLDTDTQCIIH